MYTLRSLLALLLVVILATFVHSASFRVKRQDEAPYWCNPELAGYGFNNFEAIKQWCTDNGF